MLSLDQSDTGARNSLDCFSNRFSAKVSSAGEIYFTNIGGLCQDIDPPSISGFTDIITTTA